MKTLVPSIRFIACVVLVFLAASPARAQQSSSDSGRLDDIAREAAREFAAATTTTPDQTRPTVPTSPLEISRRLFDA